MASLLSGGSPKIDKSDDAGLGYLTKIMYLAPATVSGHNACPWSTAGCRKACLNKSGRGYCGPVQKARILKTKLLFENPNLFKEQLLDEIGRFVKRCSKLDVKPAVRLNGTSDVMWENYGIFDQFPTVQFYDYTKSLGRALFPGHDNYHLTFSKTEKNDKECITALCKGVNVAVVFKNGLPETWNGFPVFNGDTTDLRFLDPKGVVVGLKAKGQAIYDTSGFVVDAEGCK